MVALGRKKMEKAKTDSSPCLKRKTMIQRITPQEKPNFFLYVSYKLKLGCRNIKVSTDQVTGDLLLEILKRDEFALNFAFSSYFVNIASKKVKSIEDFEKRRKVINKSDKTPWDNAARAVRNACSKSENFTYLSTRNADGSHGKPGVWRIPKEVFDVLEIEPGTRNYLDSLYQFADSYKIQVRPFEDQIIEGFVQDFLKSLEYNVPFSMDYDDSFHADKKALFEGLVKHEDLKEKIYAKIHKMAADHPKLNLVETLIFKKPELFSDLNGKVNGPDNKENLDQGNNVPTAPENLMIQNLPEEYEIVGSPFSIELQLENTVSQSTNPAKKTVSLNVFKYLCNSSSNNIFKIT